MKRYGNKNCETFPDERAQLRGARAYHRMDRCNVDRVECAIRLSQARQETATQRDDESKTLVALMCLSSFLFGVAMAWNVYLVIQLAKIINKIMREQHDD